MAPRRPAGIGNVAWSLKRFFGLSQRRAAERRPRRRACSAHGAPRRGPGAAVLYPRGDRPSPRRDRDRTPCGKRDYAMVVLAVSTGLRCCDIVALRLDEIGLAPRRDPAGPGQDLQTAGAATTAAGRQRHRGVGSCTAGPSAPPGKCSSAQAAVREAGRLDRIDPMRRSPGPGPASIMPPMTAKSFHALRRTTGNKAHRVRGRAAAGRANPRPCSHQFLPRYFALASEQLRQCCLRSRFTCTRRGCDEHFTSHVRAPPTGRGDGFFLNGGPRSDSSEARHDRTRCAGFDTWLLRIAITLAETVADYELRTRVVREGQRRARGATYRSARVASSASTWLSAGWLHLQSACDLKAGPAAAAHVSRSMQLGRTFSGPPTP